jgi:hypothetical protein
VKPSTVRDDIDRWFTQYLDVFMQISAGMARANEILGFWSVPLHTSSPTTSRWLDSGEAVIRVLNALQTTLKDLGYAYTEAIDKRITVYSDNAGRVETIMSRRRSDGAEVDRAAVSFELRRSNDAWIMISTTACPTTASSLHEIWGAAL